MEKVCDICHQPYDPRVRKQGKFRICSSESIVTRRYVDDSGHKKETRYLLCPSCACKIFGFIDRLMVV